MKRFHVHVAVQDLDASIHFYSALFGAEPAVVKDDYAKWMLDDPRLNFAISRRSGTPGLNHLGMQTDSDEELESLSMQLRKADLAARAEKEVACCYARSNKVWVTDPTGIAWETFHTLRAVPTFNEAPAASGEACCAPAATVPATIAVKARGAGCCA